LDHDLPIVAVVFGVLGVVFFPLARALAKRIEGRGTPSPQISPDVTARLERIERAVESVAVEVERISEGQRFVTKVLSDRGELPRIPPVQH
jgi:hypothetical protein